MLNIFPAIHGWLCSGSVPVLQRLYTPDLPPTTPSGVDVAMRTIPGPEPRRQLGSPETYGIRDYLVTVQFFARAASGRDLEARDTLRRVGGRVLSITNRQPVSPHDLTVEPWLSFQSRYGEVPKKARLTFCNEIQAPEAILNHSGGTDWNAIYEVRARPVPDDTVGLLWADGNVSIRWGA